MRSTSHNFIRRVSAGLAGLLLLTCAAASAADLVDSTRTTAFEYQAQYSDGTTSNHQSRLAAGNACSNWMAKNGGQCFVQGGRWRITVAVPVPVVVGTIGKTILYWEAPTKNTDGTPLTDLAGYYLYTGLAPDKLTTRITVADPTALQYEVTDLSPGTHYFAGTAYTTAGKESALSNIVNKAVP